MGSWWHVDIGRHAAPVWGKSYVPDELMLLFADDDLFVDRAKNDVINEIERSGETDTRSEAESAELYRRVMLYSAPAGVLRTRLELQGFSSAWVCELSSAFFDEQDDGDDARDAWPDGRRLYPNGAAITEALTTRRGQAAASGVPPHDPREQPEEYFLESQWMHLREALDDPRFSLALSLVRTRSSTMVTLDLTDLVLGGWLAPDEAPHREARSRMSAEVAANGPVVVITEGASDARWLQRSLEVAAPEVAHLFQFLDFNGFRAPGGTDRVVSLVKGMAAAGVMNRVVAVLDNDTAGQDAVRQLAALNLPAQVVVVTLPDVPYATAYPALGPEGLAMADVNGRATSIEFMFGDDVLRDAGDSHFAVRWRSFVEAVGEYQGSLEGRHKDEVGRRIDRELSKVAAGAVRGQVLKGCRRLASMLIAAADPPRRVPASEGSVLSAMWRSDPFCNIQVET